MQRPIMNPVLGLTEADGPAADAKHKWRSKLPRWLVDAVTRGWRLIRWCVRCLFSKPLARRRASFRVEDEGTPLFRLCKGVAYRLLFAPILVALTAGAFVFSGTHPKAKPMDADPATAGLHYDPVTFTSADGTRLGGWIVPVVDARQIVEQKEKALRKLHPAVVLVHDFGRTPQQMLPYLVPLHDDGVVTLSVALRGSDPTEKRAGQTFGLREAEDVAAAVEVLRRRPFVDPDRVAVLGVGTGANAAVRAAAADPSIRVMVLMSPARDSADLVARRIGPQRAGLRWMQPVCKWTFELAYGVDAEEIGLDHYKGVLSDRLALVTDRDDIEQARHTLRVGLEQRSGAEASAR